MSDNRKYQTEVDFKKIFTTPSRWLGLVYVAVLIAIIIAGRYYVQHQDNISDNDPKFISGINLEREFDVKQQAGQMQEGIDVMELGKNPSDELIAIGKELYIANCVSCHGDNGKGDGPAGASLNPPPRNFHAEDGWTNGRKFSEMFKTLEEGIVENGMNSYNQLTVKERFGIIHYVRTFADFPEITDEELSDLDLTYSLADGRTTNNQIPIEKAMKIVQKENSQKFSAIKDNYLKNQEGELIRQVTNNVDRALYALSNDETWKSDMNRFKQIVLSDIPHNGFNAGVVNMTNEEWQTLHSKLVSFY